MLEQSFDRESGTTGSLTYVTPGGTKAFSLDRRVSSLVGCLSLPYLAPKPY